MQNAVGKVTGGKNAPDSKSTAMSTSKRPVTPNVGFKDGTSQEVSLFLTIIPGHADAVRSGLVGATSDPERTSLIEGLGTVSELKWVIFDNGARLMLSAVFDGSWDAYIEDFDALGVFLHMDRALRGHIAEYPTKPFEDITTDEWKTTFQANQVPAVTFAWMHRDQTLKEMYKAKRVNKAFQAVLDDPAAQEALQHPALKPLLAEAAD